MLVSFMDVTPVEWVEIHDSWRGQGTYYCTEFSPVPIRLTEPDQQSLERYLRRLDEHIPPVYQGQYIRGRPIETVDTGGLT
jgi:hypothetical protein